MFFRPLFAIVWTSLVVNSLPLSAGIVVGISPFPDRSSWEAAVGSFVTEDFESAPEFVALTSGETVAFPHFDLVIAPNHGGIGVGEPGAILGSRGFRGDLHFGSDPLFTLLVFDRPLFAFAADLADINEGGLEVRFDGQPVVLPDGSDFVGVALPQAFTTVEFRALSTTPEEFFRMDNVSFAAIPEPSAGGLLLIASWFLLRRSRPHLGLPTTAP